MIPPSEEMERLRPGGRPAMPPAGARTDAVLASCPEGFEPVLDRCREVMVAVLTAPDPWPDLDRWKERLPAWFVGACVDDRHVQTCVVDRWSLRAWLHWLRPENRRWWWWSAQPEADGRLRVTVLVRERPYLRGALDWLLKSAGAASVEGAPQA